MSNLRVASLRGRKVKTSPSLPDGAVITGVATATSFGGNLTGNVTGNVVGNVTGDVAGNIAGTAGTFSGNVSVGGTITYEDVTSIDSVGVITARNGIKVSAGQSISAVSGIVTYYGDGSKLSGVESGVVNFVASGTIANGATVIINVDGTVAGVTTVGIGQTIGSEAEFESGELQYLRSTFDSSNNKVVFCYVDTSNSYYGTAVVGTVTGTAVTFGTPVVFSSSTTTYTAMAFDSSNNKVVIAYSDTGGGANYVGKAIVGTVSGDSISFGSAVTFNSGATALPSMAFDSTNNKIVISFRDNGNSYYGTAIVGTVSGTSISFGSEVVYESANVTSNSTTFDTSSGKILIAYRDVGNSSYGTGIVGTVSGTSISFGSPTVFRTGTSSQIEMDYDSANNKHVIVFEDESSSQIGSAVVATVSGTSVSFGSKVVFSHSSTSFGRADLKYEPTSGKFVLAFRDGSNSYYGTVMTGSVVGTSVTFTNKTTYFTGGQSAWQGISIDTDKKVSVIGYGPPNGDGGKGRARVFRPAYTSTNLTTENYIGIAAEAISNGATGKITVVAGTNSSQTGLTTAQKYFVQPTGTLATSAGDPSVVAGTAISDTKILVRKS